MIIILLYFLLLKNFTIKISNTTSHSSIIIINIKLPRDQRLRGGVYTNNHN